MFSTLSGIKIKYIIYINYLRDGESTSAIQCLDHEIGIDIDLPPTLEKSERVNGNQKISIGNHKEEDINYSHQTNIPSTHSPTYNNIAVQFNTSNQVSAINNNNYQNSPRKNISTRNYNTTGSRKQKNKINHIIGKNITGIKYSVTKCIENRETIYSTDKDHTKIKTITEKKRVPDNIFHIGHKRQRKNIIIVNKGSTIKEISTKSKNIRSQKERSKKIIIPSDDPT